MNIYPAIDMKDGKVVRLAQGDFGRATIYEDSPVTQARVFAAAGARWLHLIDLDGAKEGVSRHGAVVEEILAATNLKVQLGGGIRDEASIVSWLERGVARVILGTFALEKPDEAVRVMMRHKGKIAIGLDAKNGRLASDGWTKESGRDVMAFARIMKAGAPCCFIHTDIGRDGMLAGVAGEACLALARGAGVPVIASGGVGSLDDIRLLGSYREPLIEGVIIGRAYYEGRIDIGEALALAHNMAENMAKNHA